MSGPMRGDHGSYDPAETKNIVQRMDEAFGTDEKIAAREAGPIVQYLKHLDNELDRLDHGLSQLIEKLSPILNPMASGEAGDDVAEKQQSRISHELEYKCERVHLLASILADVTRRIEL